MVSTERIDGSGTDPFLNLSRPTEKGGVKQQTRNEKQKCEQHMDVMQISLADP